jgi:hypothetical protein
MYVLMFDREVADTPTTAIAATVPTLDQAFARICCRWGLSIGSCRPMKVGP